MPYKDPEKQKAAQKRYEEKRRKEQVHTIWWGYLYEDSAPEDWKQRLREAGIEGFAAVHDQDITAAGEPKKKHAHVAIRFSHAVNRDYAVGVLSDIGVLEKSLQYRDSWRAVARYLCHLDDPDKYQYNPADVIQVGGADYFNAISRTSDKYKTIADMMDFIYCQNFTSYAEFMDYCRQNNQEWFIALCDSSSAVIARYLSSREHDLYKSLAAARA